LDVARIEIGLDPVPFRSGPLFDQHVKRARRTRRTIEFLERPEAAPLTIWVEREFLVNVRARKTVDKALELSGAGAQEQSPHRHAAQAPPLEFGDSIAGCVSADAIAAKQEMRVHWGKSIEAFRSLSQTEPPGAVGLLAN
jgi:hypothetical protein